jgi:hypothetical protein
MFREKNPDFFPTFPGWKSTFPAFYRLAEQPEGGIS